MKAEIVATGTEILLGQIVDTNSSYLASQLPALGIDLYYIACVGDNINRMTDTLRRAWERSDLVLVTGGLGPTQGDITRKAIARMLGEEQELKVDETLLAWLTDFFKRRGMAMPERNIQQATLIPSATAISNPRGTAPGWWVHKDDKTLVAMPGPPRELQYMWETFIAPRLKQLLGDVVIASKVLKTFGIGEASVDEMLTPYLSSSNPTLAMYAKPDGIQLRITAKAESEARARELIAPVEAHIRKLFSGNLWGEDDDTLEALIGKLLTERGLSLATMESCTGGLLASSITDVPGSSRYFKGGLVAYTNEMKIDHGVDRDLIEQYGAVSPQVAAAMAQAVCRALKADVGAGITGVAGPDPAEGKQPGTVFVAVAAGDMVRNHSGVYPPQRMEVKRRAAMTALFELRRLLLDLRR